MTILNVLSHKKTNGLKIPIVIEGYGVNYPMLIPTFMPFLLGVWGIHAGGSLTTSVLQAS